MITAKTELKKYLNADFYALFPQGGVLEKIKNPIWKYVKHLRYCEYYRNKAKRTPYLNPLYCFHKMRLRNLGFKLGFSIPENTFGMGLALPHYGTIVVNPNAKIGHNC